MGVWAQITADEEAGLVYLPVESPTQDIYGGNRPGANLFGESLVAVDLKTGQRKWHFQFTHHPIWDLDIPVRAHPRRTSSSTASQSRPWRYRRSRACSTCSIASPVKPVWPIVEKPVPQSTVPGEKTSPTQPFPTKPPPYARNFLVEGATSSISRPSYAPRR